MGAGTDPREAGGSCPPWGYSSPNPREAVGSCPPWGIVQTHPVSIPERLWGLLLPEHIPAPIPKSRGVSSRPIWSKSQRGCGISSSLGIFQAHLSPIPERLWGIFYPPWGYSSPIQPQSQTGCGVCSSLGIFQPQCQTGCGGLYSSPIHSQSQRGCGKYLLLSGDIPAPIPKRLWGLISGDIPAPIPERL